MVTRPPLFASLLNLCDSNISESSDGRYLDYIFRIATPSVTQTIRSGTHTCTAQFLTAISNESSTPAFLRTTCPTTSASFCTTISIYRLHYSVESMLVLLCRAFKRRMRLKMLLPSAWQACSISSRLASRQRQTLLLLFRIYLQLTHFGQCETSPLSYRSLSRMTGKCSGSSMFCMHYTPFRTVLRPCTHPSSRRRYPDPRHSQVTIGLQRAARSRPDLPNRVVD
jgi:hypothetical protein